MTKTENIVKLYKQGLSVCEIADILGENYHCVRCCLIKEGIYKSTRKFVTTKERREWVKKYVYENVSVTDLATTRAELTILKHLVQEMKEIILTKNLKCIGENNGTKNPDCP